MCKIIPRCECENGTHPCLSKQPFYKNSAICSGKRGSSVGFQVHHHEHKQQNQWEEPNGDKRLKTEDSFESVQFPKSSSPEISSQVEMPQKRRPETQINMAYPESNMEFYGKFPEHVENQNLSGFTGILPGNGSLGSFQFPYSNLGSMAGNVTQMTPILLNQQKQTGFMQKPYIITNHQQLPNQTSNSMISSVNSLENFLVEFGNKINVLFANQNQALNDLQEKTVMHTNTMRDLIVEIKKLRGNIKESAKTDQPSHVLPIYSQIAQISESPMPGAPLSVVQMMMFLFQRKETDYQYQLVLSKNLETPLYRERNFSLSVNLVDNDDQLVVNPNRIPLTIAIYTSENPPQFIDTNTSGNKILKGFIEKDLVMGNVVFDKIQIKEVTSHFRNGWVFLLIFPKATMMDNCMNNIGITVNNFVNQEDIKPLIIEKIVVKAQKLKEGQIDDAKAKDSEEIYSADHLKDPEEEEIPEQNIEIQKP